MATLPETGGGRLITSVPSPPPSLPPSLPPSPPPPPPPEKRAHGPNYANESRSGYAGEAVYANQRPDLFLRIQWRVSRNRRHTNQQPLQQSNQLRDKAGWVAGWVVGWVER